MSVEAAVSVIYIDNRPYEIPPGFARAEPGYAEAKPGERNLLEVCLSLGFDLPYFCWHPAMHSVGACRQCAVKQFKDAADTKGRIVMACMTPAEDGARISINDPEAVEFRGRVVEWLMVNHPHDCPVCDEGGECHLQDMTVMAGHVYRRYRFTKQTWRNQDLGPFVNHEMNRCIECYRCVRFYRDLAGGRDFAALGWHDDVYFGRHADGPLQSPFAGNLVEICPTGVFTDKTFKAHPVRKWDLQTAPSVCVHCGLGCSTIPGERYGMLRRIRNRYNGEVNGYFLCDRGRYGYEFVNSPRRIRRTLWRAADGRLEEVPKEDALHRIASFLAEPGRAVGIGSPRASLEANFALRTLVGPERFALGLSDSESRLVAACAEILRTGPAQSASLADAARADAVLVLGEDVTNAAPMLALALRQSVLQKGIGEAAHLGVPRWHDAAFREVMQKDTGPLFIATPDSCALDDVATQVLRASPDDIARLGFAVARAIDASAPAPPDLSDETIAMAGRIADSLRAAARPLVVAGPSCGSEVIIRAAANIAWALCRTGRDADICFTAPEANSMGLALLGGESLADAAEAIESGAADTLLILENDLYRRAPAAQVEAILAAAKHVIEIDHTPTPTTERAEAVLPAAALAEADGTFVNNEGRAQRFLRVFVPEGDVTDSWRWLRDIAVAAGRLKAGAWSTLDAVVRALAAADPVFGPVLSVSPPADFRMVGEKIPRQPHRYSGRTAMHAAINVHEPKPPDDPDSPMAFSMEGYDGPPPAPLIREYWSPGWNSVQALNKFQAEVGGPLVGGDPGRRLIHPPSQAAPPYFADVPAPFQPREGRWLVLAAHHVFGSEELSAQARGVASLAPKPYVALGPKDAARLGVKDGDAVALALDGQALRLPVRVRPLLAAGIAAVPAGVGSLVGLDLPAWAAITPAGDAGGGGAASGAEAP